MLSYAILKIFSKVMKSYEIMPGGSPVYILYKFQIKFGLPFFQSSMQALISFLHLAIGCVPLLSKLCKASF